MVKKASKVLEVDEKVFITIERMTRKYLKKLNQNSTERTALLMGNIWQSDLSKFKLGEGLTLHVLSHIAEFYGGKNHITVNPDQDVVNDATHEYFEGIIGANGMELETTSQSFTKHLIWASDIDRKIFDLDKYAGRGIGPLETQKGKDGKSKRLKTRQTNHILKKSKEVSQNLKIKLLED